ncbi:MAG: biopolymer transporter ExbD [Verrucomicrobiota bacterium]
MRMPVEDTGTLGFQIAPMIDVVFVIMLFFMVMASSVRVEKELNTKLPGTTETSAAVEFNDEQLVGVAENGEITLNDDPVDSPESKDLPVFTNTLKRLKQSSDAAKSPVVLTIVSELNAPYQRTIDVLNACAAAKIDNVTFTVGEED